jgi:Fe-S-cluster-containing dehydrogenase component
MFGMEFYVDPSRCIGCQSCLKACEECDTHRGVSMINFDFIGIHSRELGAMPVWATSRFTTASAYLRSGRLPLGRYDIGVTHHSL